MREAAMHEHRSDQREIDRDWRRLQSRHFNSLAGEVLHDDWTGDDVFTGEYLGGHRRKSVSEFIVGAEPLEKHKDEYINQDQDVVNHRRDGAAPVVIGDWKQHSCALTSERIDF